MKGAKMRSIKIILIGCVFFSAVCVKYTYCQETALSKQEAWLKEDNLALIQRLKEFKDIVFEQNKVRLQLEEKVAQLEKEKAACGKDLPADAKGLREKANSLNDRIKALEKEKDILQAMLKLKESDLRQPEKVKPQERSLEKVIHANLGYAWALQGKTKNAINEYLIAAKCDPMDKDIHFNLGFLYAQENKFKESIEEYNKSLKIAGEDKEVYYNLAVLYSVCLHDTVSAQRCYEKYLALHNEGTAK